MNWLEFAQTSPSLAQLGKDRFQQHGLILLGTLRKNGWPRISPVEPCIADGHLYLGMMWQSRKALDILRDPRCSIHNVVSNRDGSDGEFKLYGHAVNVQDPAMRSSYADALFQQIGWRPEEPEYHLFSIDILSAAFSIIQDGQWQRQIWTAN